MAFVIDSNAPYFTDFPLSCAADAVYMSAEDEVLGNVFAVVYRARPGAPKLSVILIGAHGTSGFVDMTLDATSRYYGACKGLAPSHMKSPVRRALAIAVLRTFATTDKPLRKRLGGQNDESAAGSLGSRFRLVHGKFPEQMGGRLIDAGLISPKTVRSTLLDIVYEDSDMTIDQNNELVYLLGEQLEQLFDPLSEYSPESTERAYEPPTVDSIKGPASSGANATGAAANGAGAGAGAAAGANAAGAGAAGGGSSLDAESKVVQDLCEQIYLAEARSRAEILDLLQSTLVPLRVEVLKGSYPTLSIARLNTVFPPTIDELFRINNLFYQALRMAVPFGAYEVVKACGSSIPYFFRACMRHMAATAHFDELLSELLHDEPQIKPYLKFSEEEISSIVNNHIQCLLTVRASIEELIKARQWTPSERADVEEFFQVIALSVDMLGGGVKSARGNSNSNDDDDSQRGANALRSLSLNWPAEFGRDAASSSPRVVTAFDAVDILEPSERVRQLHIVFVVFNNVLVACRPSTPTPTSSKSGLHIPSVGDMLLHAMLNGATESVRKYVPMLEVVAWSPILDVHFASFDRSQHLYVISPALVGSFRLLQPDANADSLVSLLAKAKITTKTTPFHLFRIDAHGGDAAAVPSAPNTSASASNNNNNNNSSAGAANTTPSTTTTTTSVYSTVQEIQGYKAEQNKTQVAIFLSMNVTEKTLAAHGLVGAIGLTPISHSTVLLRVVSKLGYNAEFEISKEQTQLKENVVTEVSYLMTLALSSQNAGMLDFIIAGNKMIASRMIDWASHPVQKREKNSFNNSATARAGHDGVRTSAGGVGAASTTGSTSSTSDVRDTGKHNYIHHSGSQGHGNFVIPSDSLESIKPVSPSPTKTVKKARNLDTVPVSSRYSDLPVELSEVDEVVSNIDYSSTNSEYSSEESEQRDVDNWYHQLRYNKNDGASLSSSGISDIESSIDTQTRRSSSFKNSESIQIGGGILDRSASVLYNKNAGRAFPRIESSIMEAQTSHHRNLTESSFETIASLAPSSNAPDDSYTSQDTTLEGDDDFSYLASLVNSASISKLSELERSSAFPSLRDTSLVKLGSYVVRGGGDGPRMKRNDTFDAIKEVDVEATPRLDDGSDANDEDATPRVGTGAFESVAETPYSIAESHQYHQYDDSIIQYGTDDDDENIYTGKHSESEFSSDNEGSDSQSLYSEHHDQQQEVEGHAAAVPAASTTTDHSSAKEAKEGEGADDEEGETPAQAPEPASSPSPTTTAPPAPKFAPFADIEGEDWQPKPIYSAYKDLDPFSPKYNFIYKVEDGELGDRGSYEVAQNWLAWSQADGISSPERSPQRGSPQRGSPQRGSPQRSSTHDDEMHTPPSSPHRHRRSSPNRWLSPNRWSRASVDSHRRSVGAQKSPQKPAVADYDESMSMHTHPTAAALPTSESRRFRNMVMSSSLHTLQLASFVNQIDEKVSRVADEDESYDLETVKQRVVYAYKNRFPTREFEGVMRTQLCGCYMLLMKYRHEQLANALLEIEWVRRTRVVEVLGTSKDLWTHSLPAPAA